MDRYEELPILPMHAGGFSRRVALSRFGGGIMAAFSATPNPISLGTLVAPIAASAGETDPAAVVARYVAATNAHDIDAVLAVYAEDGAHVVMPPPPGNPTGVYLGREQIRTFYEPTAATHDHVEVVEGTLEVNGNTIAFLKRVASDPWRELGIEALDLHIYAVVEDGQFVSYVAMMTPEAVTRLFTAMGVIPAAGTPTP